jgi:hypothetical protein
MLNITDQSESSKSLEVPTDSGGASSGGGGKSYGRQVSIQELFDGELNLYLYILLLPVRKENMKLSVYFSCQIKK